MHTPSQVEGTASGHLAAHSLERRSDLEVRSRFEEACALLAPYFNPANQWGKAPFNHLATCVLRERFGNLSSAELMVMLNGVRNLYERRRTAVPFPRP